MGTSLQWDLIQDIFDTELELMDGDNNVLLKRDLRPLQEESLG